MGSGINTPTSPKYPSLSGGYPTPNDVVNGVANEFKARDTQNLVMGVYCGQVVDSWPATNSCMVQVGYDHYIKCSFCSQNSAPSIGVSMVSAPPVGSFVLLAKTMEGDHGYIIGGVAQKGSSLPGSFPTINVWGEYNPTFKEISSADTFQCSDIIINSAGIISQPNNIPGEINSFSEHNVGWIHGSLYYRIQAGPLASLTFNKIDDFVDLVAHNCQIFTSGFRLRSICDYGGRVNAELLTASNMAASAINQNSGAKIRITSGWLAAGIASHANSGGAPKSEIWQDELGAVSFKSLSGGWLQKIDGIYVPAKLHEADDPTGEGDKEVFEESIREGFEISGGDHPAAFGCQARDYVAWQTAGKYRLERFVPYEKDWKFSKIEAGLHNTVPGIGGPQYASFGSISAQTNAVTKESADYNLSRKGEAFCGTLPDGSVVLRDAWGSSVELRGGKVLITGMKDTEIVSGKSTVILSGNDVIVETRGTLELSSTTGNIRTRSGGHTLIDAKGGSIQLTALSSGAPDTLPPGNPYTPTGVTIKTNTQITSIAPWINSIASTLYSVMGPKDEGGPIIFTKAAKTMNWSTGKHYIYAGTDLMGVTRKAMMEFSNGLARSGQMMVAEGDLYTKGSLTSEKSAYIAENLLVNDQIASESNGPTIGTLKERLDIPNDWEKSDYDRFGPETKAEASNSKIEAARGFYKKDDYPRITFKYRKTEEYGTMGHVWFENFWQRQYRDALSEWSRLGDADVHGEMVYPGKLHYTSLKNLFLYDEKNVFKDGTPKEYQDQTRVGGEFSKKKFGEMKF